VETLNDRLSGLLPRLSTLCLGRCFSRTRGLFRTPAAAGSPELLFSTVKLASGQISLFSRKFKEIPADSGLSVLEMAILTYDLHGPGVADW